MNGRDIKPLIGESLVRSDIGPCRKNFAIPKELAKMLTVNDMRGRA